MELGVGCFAVLVLALAPLIGLRLAAPTDLDAFHVAAAALQRWLDAGDWVLATAAERSGRHALAQAARNQATLAFAAITASCVYFAFRGFTNARLRGWTQLYWIGGLALVFMAPAFFPNLTLARIDYALTFWVGQHGRKAPVEPGEILLARAALAAAVAALAGLCAHDVGHRLREALWELGLVDAEEQNFRTATRGRSRPRQGEARVHVDEEPRESSGFGHRSGMSETAWAFAALGLRSGASRAEIERAYRERMKRAHPDHGGSAQAAAQLNQARDLLLPHGRR